MYDWAIYGPYLLQPLRNGKYRAVFKIKINELPKEDRPIIDISVASAKKDLGDKVLERVKKAA